MNVRRPHRHAELVGTLPKHCRMRSMEVVSVTGWVAEVHSYLLSLPEQQASSAGGQAALGGSYDGDASELALSVHCVVSLTAARAGGLGWGLRRNFHTHCLLIYSHATNPLVLISFFQKICIGSVD